MANVDAPFGLRPVRYMSGAPYNGACNPYYITSGDTTPLFVGDPVVLVGDSNDDYVEAPGAGGFPEATLSEIDIAGTADDSPILGAIVGFGANPSNLEQQYKPASQERIVWVADDPDLLFHIQDDGSAAMTEDTVGLNALLASGSGDTIYGRSGFELDAGGGTAPAADASYQLLIMRLANLPNNTLAVNAVWEVMISRHQLRPAAGLLGVA